MAYLIKTILDGILHHIDDPLSGATLLGQVGRALRERFLEKRPERHCSLSSAQLRLGLYSINNQISGYGCNGTMGNGILGWDV